MRDLRTNGIKTIIIWWQYWMGDTLADGIAVIRGSTALTIDTLRPRVRESAYASWVSFAPPYYTGITLSPPEDTFNFTITFNVPAGAPTGSGYDDPIVIREDLKREKVIFRGNIK